MLNRFYEKMIDAPVAVGAPATIMLYTDRTPVVVTSMTTFKTGARAGQPKAVTVQRVEVTAQPWPSGYGEVHTDRPIAGTDETFTLRKDGLWKDKSGTILKIGKADYYRDPSF